MLFCICYTVYLREVLHFYWNIPERLQCAMNPVSYKYRGWCVCECVVCVCWGRERGQYCPFSHLPTLRSGSVMAISNIPGYASMGVSTMLLVLGIVAFRSRKRNWAVMWEIPLVLFQESITKGNLLYELAPTGSPAPVMFAYVLVRKK